MSAPSAPKRRQCTYCKRTKLENKFGKGELATVCNLCRLDRRCATCRLEKSFLDFPRDGDVCRKCWKFEVPDDDA